MESGKRQLVLDSFNNKETSRVPVGFWFHFMEAPDIFRGLIDPSIIQRNIEGHKKFYRDFEPDFIKLMSDGFFDYPNSALKTIKHVSDLHRIQPLGKEHPWISKQVDLVRELTDQFGSEVCCFYNVFSPATMLRILLGDGSIGNRVLADFIIEDSFAVTHALSVIAQDFASLASRVIQEGQADGVYLSVQSIQDMRISSEDYKSVVRPSDLFVLSSANSHSANNILHICGYGESRNDLRDFALYPAKAFNWAVAVEGVDLIEGKKIFGGRAVIGGFPNTKDSLLCSGSKEDIQGFTQNILAKTGAVGVIIGADCTLPPTVDIERLKWARQSAIICKEL